MDEPTDSPLDAALKKFDPQSNVMFFSLRSHVAQIYEDGFRATERDDITNFIADGYLPPGASEYLEEVLKASFMAGWEAYHAEAQNELFERGVSSTSSYLALQDAVTKFRKLRLEL